MGKIFLARDPWVPLAKTYFWLDLLNRWTVLLSFITRKLLYTGLSLVNLLSTDLSLVLNLFQDKRKDDRKHRTAGRDKNYNKRFQRLGT